MGRHLTLTDEVALCRLGWLSVPGCAFWRRGGQVFIRQNHPSQSGEPGVLWAAHAVLHPPSHLLPPRQSCGLFLPPWYLSVSNSSNTLCQLNDLLVGLLVIFLVWTKLGADLHLCYVFIWQYLISLWYMYSVCSPFSLQPYELEQELYWFESGSSAP